MEAKTAKTTEIIKNIYQKMSEATAKIETVAKNLVVSTGKSSYKAVSEADVLRAVKPIEVEVGIYSYPFTRNIILAERNEIESMFNGQKSTKIQMYIRIITVYRFVNVDKPEEYIDITTYGDGVDSQDKAPGKAMTYADKYALLKAYKIQTGEDPDQEASTEIIKSYRRAIADDSTETDGHAPAPVKVMINADQAGKMKLALDRYPKDSFILSLSEGLKKYGSLTDKQMSVLNERLAHPFQEDASAEINNRMDQNFKNTIINPKDLPF